MTRAVVPSTRHLPREDPVLSRLPTTTTTITTISTPSFRLRSLLFLAACVSFDIPFFRHSSVNAAVTPTWRAFHGAAIVDTSMVVFGGTVDPTQNPFGASVLGSNDLWVWSTTLRQWSQPTAHFPGSTDASSTGPRPQKFITSIPLQSQGKMMALVSNSSTDSSQCELLMLDTNFLQWSIPNSQNPGVAPSSRLGAAVGVSDSTIYIHGGAQAANTKGFASTTALNDMNKLDDSTFTWTSIANGPALMYHTMCKLPRLNKMVVFGGSDPADTFNDVHTFNLADGSWDLHVSVSGGGVPSVRKGHSAVCLEDLMIVYGGGADRPLDDDVWVLNATSTDLMWSRMTTNKQLGPGPRTGHSALLNGTNMLVWGGYGAPQPNDTNIYILDTLTWQWTSSKDIRASTPPLAAPGESGGQADNKNNAMPLTIGVVCGSLALMALVIGLLIVRRRRSTKKGQNLAKPAKDDASYLSDAEQYLSREMSLDDKPSYYHHHSGRDSGSSLGGWPSVAGRRNISATPQGYPMHSMSSLGQQAAAAAAATAAASMTTSSPSPAPTPEHSNTLDSTLATRATDITDITNTTGSSDTTLTTTLTQPQKKPSLSFNRISQQDADQASNHTGFRAASIASDPYYPAHLAEHDEEDADRWTFASSLSFDQREKAGTVPTLRYIPTRNSAMSGLSRTKVHSSASLTPSFPNPRVPRKDVSAPSILSGHTPSVGGAPSIVLNVGGSVAPSLSRDGSINARDTALFNSLSPLDRVSLMCSGLDVESQLSGEDEGLTATHLHPQSSFPQWRNNYRHENLIGSVVDEEEEEEGNSHLHRSTSASSSSMHQIPLDHPALASLTQNLPARYMVAKSPSPIHGLSNDIVFAVDSDTQQPIVIKSFKRREAWERECRTLRRLRGPCVVELKHVATLVLSETDDPNKPATIRLTILERLDETLAQMLKNARKAKKLALREQAAASTGGGPGGLQSGKAGETLDLSGVGLYRAGPALSESHVVDIVKGVLRCLMWCHSKKVVYCDLKPTNIMRNRDDPRQQWKLIDLESSRTAEEERTSPGTIRYCPPEVAKAAVDAQARTDRSSAGVTAQYSMDLWAFGCLLYELFATRPLIPMSAKKNAVLHFLANPSDETPPLSNGLRWKNALELEIPYFEEAVWNKSARQLIRILLHPDPQRRATMDQVLNSVFLSTAVDTRTPDSSPLHVAVST